MGIDPMGVETIVRTNLQSLRYSVMQAIDMVIEAIGDSEIDDPAYRIVALDTEAGTREKVLTWWIPVDGWVFFSYETQSFKPSHTYLPAALADYAEIGDAIANNGWLQIMAGRSGREASGRTNITSDKIE